MSTMKQLCALCLAALLLLVFITYLFCMVPQTGQKIDELQQTTAVESEPIQVHNDNHLTVIIVIDSQTEPTEEPDPTEATQPTENKSKETQPTSVTESTYPANYYGRLCIPDAGIDVGLYHGADQAICDREDSANIFTMSVFDGMYIADHITQEFAKLSNVQVGMHGCLNLADGAVLNIVCTDVLNGHHTGKHIVDENGNTNLDGDYLMYTCRDSWQNILICLWKHG